MTGSILSLFRFLLFVLLLCIPNWNCSNYNLKYAQHAKGWQQVEAPQNQEIIYSIYLIGDAGNAPMGQSTPLFEHLKEVFENADQNSSAFWLGDNLYPVGLAPEGHEDYELGAHRITAQLKTMNQYQGDIYFIPGNHDWYEYGQEGITRMENLIEGFLQENRIYQSQNHSEYFLPNNGCGDVETRLLHEGIAMIIIDSHWYLNSRYKKNINSVKCQVKSYQDYLKALESAFEQNKDNFIILAAHHPIYTYGKHGGYYQPKYYFFPLTQVSNSLIIPLPFSGIIANIARPYISEQDTKHALYGRYRSEIISLANAHGNTAFTAGHEHNLQYIERDNIPIIISGSGSKKTAVALGNGSHFAIGNYGYSRIDFYTNGDKIVHFISYDNDKLQEVFRTKLFEKK